METKKLININAIEEVSLSYSTIRDRHVVGIRTKSGSTTYINFTSEEAAYHEYCRLKEVFQNVEIIGHES